MLHGTGRSAKGMTTRDDRLFADIPVADQRLAQRRARERHAARADVVKSGDSDEPMKLGLLAVGNAFLNEGAGALMRPQFVEGKLERLALVKFDRLKRTEVATVSDYLLPITLRNDGHSVSPVM